MPVEVDVTSSLKNIHDHSLIYGVIVNFDLLEFLSCHVKTINYVEKEFDLLQSPKLHSSEIWMKIEYPDKLLNSFILLS